MEKYFSDQQIEQANSINIIDYARSRGYPVRQITTHSFKIPCKGWGFFVGQEQAYYIRRETA